MTSAVHAVFHTALSTSDVSLPGFSALGRQKIWHPQLNFWAISCPIWRSHKHTASACSVKSLQASPYMVLVANWQRLFEGRSLVNGLLEHLTPRAELTNSAYWRPLTLNILQNWSVHRPTSLYEGAKVSETNDMHWRNSSTGSNLHVLLALDWSIINKKHFISPAVKDRQLLEQVPRVYAFLCARRKQGDAKEEEEVKGNIWCITSAPGLLTVGNH